MSAVNDTPENQSLPCMARGETRVDGAVLPVSCDLWHGHERRHWDDRVFTFWSEQTSPAAQPAPTPTPTDDRTEDA